MNRSEPILGLLWRRFSWRHWRLAPASSGLLVLILALGIAVFMAIRLANRAAVASFQNFTDILTAESDGVISAPAGALPETILPELRQLFGDEPVRIVPVLETSATAPRRTEDEAIGSRATFQVLGVDLIALQNLASQQMKDRGWFNQATDSAGDEPDVFWARFLDPRSVFVPATMADRVRLGDPLDLVLQESVVTLRVAGFIPTAEGRPAPPADMIVMDLPALQHWTGQTGRVTRIEFLLPETPDRAARWARLQPGLEAASAGRWRVGTPADRRNSAATMTLAFRLNLTVLSLLALVVGLYLIFQALEGAVVRRREEIAVLQALGVTPQTIRRAWLVEAAMLGLAGGFIGLGLGWVGAQGAVRLVGQTVNALYFASSARAAVLEPAEAALALIIAVASSVLAGWLPARHAADTPPAQLLGRGRAQMAVAAGASAWAWAGGLFIAGAALALVPPLRLAGGTRVSVAAYFAALCWLVGAGLLAGALLPVIGRLTRPAGARSAAARLALSQLRVPTSRHRLATAGLVCAVAMTAGMAILVGSFDRTMRGWIERTFMADLYLSSDGAQSASTQNRIRPEVWRPLVNDPAVRTANVMQAVEIQLPIGSTLLVGAHLDFMRTESRIAWREAPLDNAVWDPLTNTNLALASESFGDRFRVRRGDTVTVPTPAGPRVLRLAGIFSDYGNERGSLVVERSHFAAWFGDELASSLIIALKPGQAPETVRGAWRGRHPGLAIFTNGHLRREALRIFRDTFAITHALELIGVTVAVAGLAFTLVSLLWERRADLTTLRALGLRHQEIAAATAWEGALTAAVGIVVGLAASVALGWLLIFRVNKQTFGWTLEMTLPWDVLAGLGALVLLSAAVTGWITGRWGANLPAEREE
jgi:putative ABC transport system permease protein